MAEPATARAAGAGSSTRPWGNDRAALVLFVRRMAVLGVVVAGVLGAGTVGFVLSEQVDAWFAFQWALDTVATVGSFHVPTSIAGQIVRVMLIIFGVGTLFYALVTVTEFFVAGHLGELMEERRAQKMIDSLTDHYIICGFGRVGRQVARDLQAAQARYVVIDATDDNRSLAQTMGVRFIDGDAAEDEILRRAGIDRARGIIACADSDAANIFITLTAREMRGDIAIVARASVEDSEKKLKRAGADRVISPYKASGSEMARLALHPQLAGVVAVDTDYRFEEIVVSEGCEGEAKMLGDVRGGSIIVGLRRRDGTFQPQPPAETVLTAGDALMALGTPRTLDRLEKLFLPAKDRRSRAS